MSRRTIVVDGIEYRWQMGDYLAVWRDGKRILTVSHEALKGCSPDDIERAHCKGYGDGSIRSVHPSEVATAIRNASKEAQHADR